MSWSAFQTFTDLDAFTAAFPNMRAESVITGRGDFRTDLATIQLDRVLLRHARETLPRTGYSAADPREFAIGFINDPRQEIYVNGFELAPGAMFVFPSEAHIRFGSATRWNTVSAA